MEIAKRKGTSELELEVGHGEVDHIVVEEME